MFLHPPLADQALRPNPGGVWRRRWILLLVLVAGVVFQADPAAAKAGAACGNNFFWLGLSGSSPAAVNCTGFRCHPAIEDGRFIRLDNPSCDPTATSCTVELGVVFEFPGLEQMIADFGLSSAPTPKIQWLNAATGTQAGICGIAAAGGKINRDFSESWVERGGITCANAGAQTGTYDVKALVCQSAFGCGEVTLAEGLTFDTPELAAAIGCPPPPRERTCRGGTCGECVYGVGLGGGGAEVNEAQPGFADTGPGALLRYAAGGAGGDALPGSAQWRPMLGRFWSHSYAQRVVSDTVDNSHVWLLTEDASFRQFTDADLDGVYETASPADEHRRLTFTSGAGWQLIDLSGTKMSFDLAGAWTGTEDRNGNSTTPSYDASGRLERVSLPDGRREDFTYYAAPDPAEGKLETITEVGVDPASALVWTYRWSGEDLVGIDRPDGTSLAFSYEDARHPGYLTRMVLVGTAAGERLLRAWQYDAVGAVIATWRGDAVAGANGPEPGPAAVDRYAYVYDKPSKPTVTEVTDPLGQHATYTLERDAGGTVRVTSISGACPTCGLGPSSQLEYGDPANSLAPTRIIDGRGGVTDLEYDAFGQVTRRLELEPDLTMIRETTWQYDPTFPAFPVRREGPFDAAPATRVATFTYDPLSGDLLTRTIEGEEATFSCAEPPPGEPCPPAGIFKLVTQTSYNAAGQPTTVDPPGHGAADQTSFTYDPARGDLLPVSRTDPLVGASSFAYDAFNRRTAVTDPNGVTTETVYDALDRVVEVIRRAGTLGVDFSLGDPPQPGDLATTHEYSEFGDLFRTTLPADKVIEYAYDAAGRLIAIERKPDASTPGERILYTLDATGNRTDEALQSWDTGTASWVTAAEARFEYSTRCHLDRVVRAPGSSEESVTEYAYDCNGNLERVWDGNHPRFDPGTGLETTPTQLYIYDTLNRLTRVTQPWGGAGGGDTVTGYAYDLQDHLVEVTDAEGNPTSYTYSDRDLLTQEVSSASGTTSFTYDEHGEEIEHTDARSVTVRRTIDALDRVTLVDYADNTLDTTYAYDTAPAACAGGSFPTGRLGSISRNGQSVDFCYDRFGRTTRDGELTYAYDADGNRTEVSYPAGVTARFSYDFADRPVSLEVDPGTGVFQPVVSAATYLPSGPLTSLSLGNATSESRTFDGRYQLTSITHQAPKARRWDYQTDGVGNVTEIDTTAGCLDADLVLSSQTITTTQAITHCAGIEVGPAFAVESPGDLTLTAGTRVALKNGFSVGSGASFRAGIDPALAPVLSSKVFTYQDVQYYLTGADGSGPEAPWGTLAWTYDRIGNRLTEGRNGATDSYGYAPNASGGNTPLLTQITLAAGGTRDYQHGPAGHLERVTADANRVDFASDQAGRLAAVQRFDAATGSAITPLVPLLYDGRSFLTHAGDLAASPTTRPVYDSAGLLMALRRQASAAEPELTDEIFYFAGRPVAQIEVGGAVPQWSYFTTDHLGTPQVATDETGVEIWSGGFEPFGRDPQEATPAEALASGVFLRFPGQWETESWQEATLGAGVYYNVNRWYEAGEGRYTRPDPMGLEASVNIYAYVDGNPLSYSDAVGLTSYEGFDPQVEAILKGGVEEAKERLKKGCADCDSRRLLDLLNETKFIADETLLTRRFFSACGEVTFWGFLTNTIRIDPRALTDPGFSQQCCAPAGLIVHETTHLMLSGRLGEGAALTNEHKCFGCEASLAIQEFLKRRSRPQGSVFGGP